MEGGWRLCTTRCSPPRTSVVCRGSSSTPTSNHTFHHVRERPQGHLWWGEAGRSVFIDYSRPVIELHFFAHMPDLVTAVEGIQDVKTSLI